MFSAEKKINKFLINVAVRDKDGFIDFTVLLKLYREAYAIPYVQLPVGRI